MHFALLLLLLVTGCATAPERSLLERALDRRGGTEKVIQAAGVVRTSHGTLRGVPCHTSSSYREPNMLRWKFQFDGIDQVVEQVFDGRSAYQENGTRKVRLGISEARIVRNKCMDESVFWMVGLADPNLTVAELGPGEYDGIPILGMRVEHRTGYSRDLFFDASTLDLLGSEGMSWTETGRRRTLVLYSDFQNVEGMRLPMRQKTLVDGEVVSEEICDSISFEKVPPPEAFAFQ
ncbi:MAG: hypothetical protein V2A76_16950 [Planctomycetota bacterium]